MEDDEVIKQSHRNTNHETDKWIEFDIFLEQMHSQEMQCLGPLREFLG